MSNATTQHAAMTELRAQLAARPALEDGVTILSGPSQLSDVKTRDLIELVKTRADENWRTLGRLRKEEKYEIEGAVYTTMAGAGETVIETVRARATALLDELKDTLADDPSIGGTVRVATLARSEMFQTFNDKGRGCGYEFWVSVEAHLNIS